jgi:hypothetical protein
MDIQHSWKVVGLTSQRRQIMITTVELQLTSTLDMFTLVDTITVAVPPNFSESLVQFEDVTEEMCIEWTDILGKFQKEKLIKQHQDKLTFMYEDWYMRCNRKYSEEKLPWNKNN